MSTGSSNNLLIHSDLATCSVTVTMSKPQRKISTHRTSRGCVQHVICMVGMPARGKTYIGTKLARYTSTVDISVGTF